MHQQRDPIGPLILKGSPVARSSMYICIYVCTCMYAYMCSRQHWRIRDSQALRYRNHAKRPQSDRTPPPHSDAPSVQDSSMIVFWLNRPKAIPLFSAAPKPANEIGPPIYPWRRII